MKKLILVSVLIITAIVPISARVSRHKGYVEGCVETADSVVNAIETATGLTITGPKDIKAWCEGKWDTK